MIHWQAAYQLAVSLPESIERDQVGSPERNPLLFSTSSKWALAALVALFFVSITLSFNFPMKGGFGLSRRGLSQGQAEIIALRQVPKGEVGSEEERMTNGHLTWLIDVHLPNSSDLQEVSIDATNGHVMAVRRETAEDEAFEVAVEDHRYDPKRLVPH